MNTVNIIGALGRDVELKYLPNGTALGSFSIAVNQNYKDKSGQIVEKTSWFDVTAFGRSAEVINQYFKKGSRIAISGELEQQKWTANTGEKRSRVVIKLNGFDFLDKGENSNTQSQNNNSYASYASPPKQEPKRTENVYNDDEEIPF